MKLSEELQEIKIRGQGNLLPKLSRHQAINQSPWGLSQKEVIRTTGQQPIRSTGIPWDQQSRKPAVSSHQNASRTNKASSLAELGELILSSKDK